MIKKKLIANDFSKKDLQYTGINSRAYANSFRLIIKDLLEITNYVEPTNENLKVYSHRIYELFLRSCAEFESICKDILIINEYGKNVLKFNIKDYGKLYSHIRFREIMLLYWQPCLASITPFMDWETQDSLRWYQDYNLVKHNRDKKFARANFNNLVCAIASVFSMLVMTNSISGMISQDLRNGTQITNYHDYYHSACQKF